MHDNIREDEAKDEMNRTHFLGIDVNRYSKVIGLKQRMLILNFLIKYYSQYCQH